MQGNEEKELRIVSILLLIVAKRGNIEAIGEK